MMRRDRRAMVVGGTVVVIAVLVLRVLPAGIRALRGVRRAAAENLATAARAREVLRSAPSVHDSLLETLNGIVALAPKLVGGQSSPDAQATLSGLVNGAAASHDLKVVGLDPLADSSVGVLVRVALHSVLEGDSRGFTGFLSEIETGDPVLTISALAVSAPDPAGHPGAPEVLHIELDVSGYYLPRARS